MWMKPISFLSTTLLLIALMLPGISAAAATAPGNALSDGQFVYGPNVGRFDVKDYLHAHATHLAPYAEALYGRAAYHSINPKVYLTLLELHSQLLSRPNPRTLENPFGLKGSGFLAQIDELSTKMTAAYYAHLYKYSAQPFATRNMDGFLTPGGSLIQPNAEINAGTYAILAGLAAINTPNVDRLLDNSQPDGFYQTWQHLFENDDPLDERNRISIPQKDSLVAPTSLLQLPFQRGLAWKFGGVHDSSGCSGLGTSGCDFTDASAMDFYPIGSTWGMDTSAMWVVAAGAGTPTRVSNCYFTVTHADGWATSYYHLENTQVYAGLVAQNDKIGVIANSQAEATCNGGAASGPHVHFWLRHNGANVAINGTDLSNWYVHAGRWSYDTDPNYMWLERSGAKKYAYGDTVLSEAPSIVYKTITLTSGPSDGFVLESAETSTLGGTINSSAIIFRLGDDAAKKQYRSILSFNTGALPDTAVITDIKLKIRRQSTTGNAPDPATSASFKGLMFDIKTGFFGAAALEATDFQAAASKTYGPVFISFVNNFYTINLTSNRAYINKLASNGGLTQIRLRFNLDDNNNAVADYTNFYSSEASIASLRPQLVVTYYLP